MALAALAKMARSLKPSGRGEGAEGREAPLNFSYARTLSRSPPPPTSDFREKIERLFLNYMLRCYKTESIISENCSSHESVKDESGGIEILTALSAKKGSPPGREDFKKKELEGCSYKEADEEGKACPKVALPLL